MRNGFVISIEWAVSIVIMVVTVTQLADIPFPSLIHFIADS